MASGGSPFSISGYLYPPALALVGGKLLGMMGESAVLLLLRVANLVGAATIVWCSIAWLPWDFRRRFLAAALYLCLAPVVGYSLCSGNVSNAVVAVTLLALLIWPSKPWAAGAGLGAGIAIKPIAPVAALAVLFHKPAQKGRAQLVAGASALAIAAVLTAPLPWFRDMFAVDISIWLDRTVSLYRLAVMPGWTISPFLFTLIIAVATLVAVRLRTFAPTHLLVLATTAAIAASPMVRPHTLLLLLPVQFLALQVALRRRSIRSAQGAARFEPWLILLAVVAIQLAEGATALDFEDGDNVDGKACQHRRY